MRKRLRITILELLMTGTFGLLLNAADRVPPNIVLIIADDLGYGDLVVYGCDDISTPRLDLLAKEGIQLTQGYVSAPYCGPSRGMDFTIIRPTGRITFHWD